MEEMQQITIDQWMSWKEDIREKLRETAGNFVYIGYRLKQIRDSGMYGGAEDIFEFASKEYGLGKSTVSRFIAINEKFSEGGNSLELKEEYRAIGSSKLAEMLTLTDAECRLITEKATVSQIREFKNFSRQEPEEGDDAEGQGRKWTPLQKCIIEYFRGKKEMLDTAMECIARNDYKQAAEVISPNGYTTVKKGIIFLFLYDYEQGVKYRTFGSEDTIVLAWDDFIMEICEIFWPDYSVGINGYDALYGAAGQKPEKAEKTPEILNEKGFVATSQQEEKEGEEDAEKMEDTAAPEDGDEKDDGKDEEPADPAEPEDDENGGGGEVEDADAADMAAGLDESDVEEPDDETDVSESKIDNLERVHQEIRGYKAGIKTAMTIMQVHYDKQDWTGIIKKAEDIIWRAEQIQKIQSGEEN